MAVEKGAHDEQRERGEVLWEPPRDVWSTTAIGRFAQHHGFDDYARLHAWSIADLEGFWRAATEATGLQWRSHPKMMLASSDMPGARWFPGGELNYAEHALRTALDPERVGEVAVIAHSQTREPVELTWGQLASQVAAFAAWLQSVGVERGDRVVAYAPNVPETLVAFLAAASIGAIWSSCAPEFGVRSVIDRYEQIEPKVLLVIDGYRYGDKPISRTDHVESIVEALPTLERIVVLPYLDHDAAAALAGRDERRVRWSETIEPFAGAGDDVDAIEFTAVPADHPLYVLFSSGTTGLPKAIVHGHGGISAEHLKVLTFHHDLTPHDRFFWFTTTGWMMWNYLVSGLLVGTPIILFDGDPGWPDLNTLWNLADQTGCTVFGVSSPFVMSCRKAGLTPARGSIRAVGATGAPLPPEGFRWVRETLDVPVASMSGGTDVCTAFVGPVSLLPVRAGEITCRMLGCAVEAFGPGGESLPPGETGELVLTAPLPSIPVGFWGDHDGSRYRAAYFDDFPGVWRHGDWVTFTDDGACVISGRSDATLNRGGVRLGTSDFYAVAERFDEVVDSLVVHLDHDDPDGRGMGHLALYVKLAEGCELDHDLRGRITKALRAELSPRHVPDSIEAVPDVPRTLSGKKLEVPVKRILQGADAADVASKDALANPSALDWYVEHRSAVGRAR